jgi:hypothetical protein
MAHILLNIKLSSTMMTNITGFQIDKGKYETAMTKRNRSISLLSSIIIGFMGFMANAHASQCVECHNSPKKLIQITREIAKTRPVEEAKSKGLG